VDIILNYFSIEFWIVARTMCNKNAVVGSELKGHGPDTSRVPADQQTLFNAAL
jgi:hypothetical protein